MKILLINPNTFQNPPVIPLGLEYLLTPLRNAGHETEILDLCFSGNPQGDMEGRLKNKKFDLAGVTIRNIDSSVYFNNRFFLDDIKKIVDYLKRYGIPVVLGGSGFSAMPEEILGYLGGDFGITGPGENAMLKLIKDIENGAARYRLIDGWKEGFDKKLIHLRGEGGDLDYGEYIKNDAILGFETQKGCPNRCSFCMEAGNAVRFKKIENVIKEIRHLVEKGYDRFHLCDSEFNLKLSYSMDFCRALIKEGIGIKWALYMAPYPYCRELFRLLKESGACLITLSVVSYDRQRSINNYDFSDVKKIIEYSREYGIKLAVDLMTGFPFEEEESMRETMEFFKENRPDSVGVSFYFRLYGNTDMGRKMGKRREFAPYLTRKLENARDFVKPVFFSRVKLEYIRDLIGTDTLFNIEGFRKDVNYQRI